MHLDEIEIGASEAAAPLGLSPYQTPYQWYLQKTGQADRFEGNEATRLGQIFEPSIAAAFEGEHGLLMEKGVPLFHPEHAWMRATPDYIFDAADASAGLRRRLRLEEGEHVLLEIKTTGLATWKPAHIVKEEWGEDDSDVIPIGYLVQVQQQMAVLDAQLRKDGVGFCRSAIVKALIPGRGVPEFIVRADRKVQTSMQAELNRVVHEHLVPEVPLERLTTEDFKASMRNAMRMKTKRIEVADFDVEELALSLRIVREQLADAELREAKIKAELSELIGDGYGFEGDFGKVVFTAGKDGVAVQYKAIVDDAGALITAMASDGASAADVAKAWRELKQSKTKPRHTSRTLRVTWKKD